MRHFIFALLTILSLETVVYGQSLSDKLGIGFNIGGQKIYGDYLHTGFGLGLESYLKYQLNDKFFVKAALGYGELSDGTLHLDKSTFTTNLINLDVKGAYNLRLNQSFQPFVYLGLGIINFQYEGFDQRFFDGSFILGGGAEYLLSPQMGINGIIDYRFTTGDDFDGMNYGAKDGYLNIRGGITYYLSPRQATGPKVLADNSLLEDMEGAAGEGEENSAMAEGLDDYEKNSNSEFAMEEYIKLKSRIDELNDAIRQKELEIEELKAQLDSRKERVSTLESRMRTKGGALASSLNVDVSDFSTSYEKGLEHFYAHEYDAAIYIFSMLVDSYPNHKLASNSRYWLGECYFGKRNYEEAINNLNMVLAYENSVKKDDALLMMGRSYVKLGNTQSAKEMFTRLMNDYPESEYIEKAEKLANEIR